MLDFRRNSFYLEFRRIRNVGLRNLIGLRNDSTESRRIPTFSTKGFQEIATILNQCMHYSGLTREDLVPLLQTAECLEIALLEAHKTDEQMLEISQRFRSLLNWIKNCPSEYFEESAVLYGCFYPTRMEYIAYHTIFTHASKEWVLSDSRLDSKFINTFNEFLQIRNAFFEACSIPKRKSASEESSLLYSCFLWVAFISLALSFALIIVNDFFSINIISENDKPTLYVVGFFLSIFMMIKNYLNSVEFPSDIDYSSLIKIFVSLCKKMDKQRGWRAFSFDSTLKPQTRQEFAEQLYAELCKFDEEAYVFVLKKYLADINASKEFDADFFIKEIEEIPVDSGKLCLKSCYSYDLTHENLVNITKSIIEEMHKPAAISMYSRLFHHATIPIKPFYQNTVAKLGVGSKND